MKSTWWGWLFFVIDSHCFVKQKPGYSANKVSFEI